jgi:hypothetical protein
VAVIAEFRIPYFLAASWIGAAVNDTMSIPNYTKLEQLPINNETLMHIWTPALQDEKIMLKIPRLGISDKNA